MDLKLALVPYDEDNLEWPASPGQTGGRRVYRANLFPQHTMGDIQAAIDLVERQLGCSWPIGVPNWLRERLDVYEWEGEIGSPFKPDPPMWRISVTFRRNASTDDRGRENTSGTP